MLKSKHIVLLAMSGGLLLPLQAFAANPQEAQQRVQEMQQRQQEQQQRMQQMQQAGQQQEQQRQQEAQQRQQQVQQQREQMQQARQQQEQQRQQAQQQRQQQEQALRQQEQQSRQAQQQAIHQQQEQARQQKDQARQQDIQARQQRNEQWHQQADQNRQLNEQARQQAHQEGRQAWQQQADLNRQQADFNHQQAEQARQQGDDARRHAAERLPRPGAPSFSNDFGGNPISHRAERPAPIKGNRLPLNKAIAMPELARNASREDRDHLRQVQRNLQAHLIAVSAANRPRDWDRRRDWSREHYFDNYRAIIANQQYEINRQNTFINALQQNQYPYWYQPQPGWQFANGFTFGNAVQDLNWLRWGWHPYYGPQPDGFICSQDYFPTPWIFIPAYGTWRQPGINAYSPSGPPYDYTGPISVEVFEPRQINVSQPFYGGMPPQVMNVVYMFNAFYFPEEGRYGYTNQYGNWIWLDLNPLPY